jgi:hypothetical protein
MAAGKAGDLFVSELHGKYYSQNYNGRVVSFSLTTATAIPVFATNPTPNFLVINPFGNTTNLVLARLNLGFVGGTGVAGAIAYAYVPGLVNTNLSATGPASAITVNTANVKTGIMGGAYNGNIIFATAATLLGTAPYVPVIQRYSNLSQGAPITTTAATYALSEDFDGTLIVPPGSNLFLTASTAIAETVVASLICYEASL